MMPATSDWLSPPVGHDDRRACRGRARGIGAWTVSPCNPSHYGRLNRLQSPMSETSPDMPLGFPVGPVLGPQTTASAHDVSSVSAVVMNQQLLIEAMETPVDKLLWH
jgi:hypothetical protein